MSTRLFAMTCGRLTGPMSGLMEGATGEAELPIPCYLIEHPKGRVLFDSGMHPDCLHDPAGRYGARISQVFKFDYKPGDEVSAKLESIGRDPRKVDLVINSHLHFDHVGGNALLPEATVMIQRAEWQAGFDPDIAAMRGFHRKDFDLGHKVVQLDGEHDVFGDGCVVCLPTHGHTPGHQSLKVRLEGREIVLAADACYFCQTLTDRKLPPRVHDREAMHASLDRLAAMQASGATIFFGHDAEFWKTVPQAPAEIT